MAAEYELTTLKDVFDKVPADKIELCLSEIAKGMVIAKSMWSLLEMAGKEIQDGGIGQVVYPETITWVDDGKGEIGCDFSDGEKNLFGIRVVKESE